MEQVNREQADAHYKQVWQNQLASEARTWLTLEQQQQQEKDQSYLQEIHIEQRTRLVAQHEAERNQLLRQHREQRIALRKSQQA